MLAARSHSSGHGGRARSDRGRHAQRRRNLRDDLSVGAQVDHVLEFDVMTGTGRAGDLLAGTERRAVPDGARGAWDSAESSFGRGFAWFRRPEFVEMRPLNTTIIAASLSDQARLTTVDALGPLGGGITRGRRMQALRALRGHLPRAGTAGEWPATGLAGLRYNSEAPPATMPTTRTISIAATASVAAGAAQVRERQLSRCCRTPRSAI